MKCLMLLFLLSGCSLDISDGFAITTQFYQYKHIKSGTIKLCSNEQQLPLEEWVYQGDGLTTDTVVFCALN